MSSWEPSPFQLEVRADGDTMIVSLAGEFDLAVVDCFQSCIDAALTTCDGALVVDLADVTFIDSSGLHALLKAREAARSERRRLRCRGASRAAARLFELAGVTELLDEADTTSA